VTQAPLHAQGLKRLDGTRYRLWVRNGIAAALAAYLVVLLGGLVLHSSRTVPVSWLGATAAALSVALALAWQGRVGLATGLAAGAVWLELHARFLAQGDLSGAAPAAALPAFVVGVGLLLGGRVAFLAAAISSLTAPWAAWAGRTWLGAPGVATGQEGYTAVLLASSLLVTALLVYLGLRTFDDVLGAALRGEARMAALLDNTPDAILALDHDGRVAGLNPAGERLLGVDEPAALGRPLAELLGVGTPSGPDLSGVDRLYAARGAAPIGLELPRVGDRGPVWIEGTSRRFVHEDGTIGVQVVLRDVTERKRAEDRATQLGRILQEMRYEAYLVDPGTLEILLASRGTREKLGYADEESPTLALTEISPGVARSQVDRILVRLDSGEGVVHSTGIQRRRDGSVYPVEWQIQDALLDGRRVLVVFARDMTARVEAEEEQRKLMRQLEHAQRMDAVGRLAGGVAHDFNNLLTVIGGSAEILAEETEGEPRELAGEILEAQQRGAVLTKQLLAFARKEVVQLALLRPGDVLHDFTSLLERVLGERGTLRIRIGCTCHVLADRGQLEQVILNLVTNARDAIRRGGTVEVSTHCSGEPGRDVPEGFVAIRVSDDGRGMDARVAEQALEPFFTTKERGHGTGLGLSTVHGIVSQNGGRLDIRSEPGAGTVVTVLWPLAPVDVETVGLEAPPKPAREESRTVLVVEDDDGTRGFVRLVLERAGYRVLLAGDGEQAAGLLAEKHGEIDLVLSDVVMPRRSGIELAEEVCRHHPDIPVLLMSGYMDGHAGATGKVDPRWDLMLKPFGPGELSRRVAAAVHGSWAEGRHDGGREKDPSDAVPADGDGAAPDAAERGVILGGASTLPPGSPTH